MEIKIKAGRKFKSNYGHIKVEVLFVYEEGGVLYKLSKNGFISGCSAEAFIEMYKPITTHKVFRVWKFLEDDTLTSKQKETWILQGWPQKSDGKTLEEMHHMFMNLHVSKAWFVEEEVDEWRWTKEGTK
jgi:hypothetical protein